MKKTPPLRLTGRTLEALEVLVAQPRGHHGLTMEEIAARLGASPDSARRSVLALHRRKLVAPAAYNLEGDRAEILGGLPRRIAVWYATDTGLDLALSAQEIRASPGHR